MNKNKLTTIILLSFLMISFFTTFTSFLNIPGASATETYSRVQGPTKGVITSGNTIYVVLAQTPTIGNILIATIAGNPVGSTESVNTIVESGVSWYKAVSAIHGASGFCAEIWYGNITGTANTTISITFTYDIYSNGGIADIAEYSGLSVNPLDQTASATGSSSSGVTGTTSTTTSGNELLIGVIAQTGAQSNPTNDFTLFDGVVNNSVSVAFLEKTVTSTGAYSSGTDSTGFTYAGCIATFKVSAFPSYFTLNAVGLYNSTSYTLNGVSRTFNSTVSIDPGDYTLVVPANITNLFYMDFLGFSSGANTTTRTVTVSGSTTMLTVYYVPDSQQPNIATSYEFAQAAYNDSAIFLRLELGQPVRYQPKSFYAAGRVWVFFVNSYHSYYTSSVDGVTWATPTLVTSTLNDSTFIMFENLGENLQATLDTNGKVHVIIRGSMTGYSTIWNLGTPLSNGTILFGSWTNIWNVGATINYDIFLAVDSSGYDWVTWIVRNGTSNALIAIKNGNIDGTWSQNQNISVANGGGVTNQFIIPLPNNKLIFVYYSTLYPGIFCKTLDGSTLGAEETISTNTTAMDYSAGAESYARAVAQDAAHNVYFSFITTGNNLNFVTRSITTGEWSTETTIKAGVINGSSPCFSIFNDVLIIYYIYDAYHIVSQSYFSGTWSTPMFVTNETQPIPLMDILGYNGRLNSFGEQVGNQVGLIWVENSTTPGFFSLRYAGVVPQLEGALTLSPGLGGYTVPSAGSYTFSLGNITTITAYPYEGNSFLYWTINGETNTSNPLTISINGYMTITPHFTAPPAPTEKFIAGVGNTQFFFRSDTFTNNNSTAYGLDPTNTNSEATITDTASGDSDVTYGFKVWVVSRTGATTELTAGTPVAQMQRTSDGSGIQTATWTPNEYTFSTVGFYALKISVYLSFDDGGSWTNRANFISKPLVSKTILHQTWTYQMYTEKTTATDTNASFTFGAYVYPSSILNVGLAAASQTELQSFRFLSGDWIGFIISTYTAQIGSAAYLLILLIPCTTLYLRHKNAGPVLILFALFGTSGVGVYWMVPGWAAAALDIFLVLIASFLVWKLLR